MVLGFELGVPALIGSGALLFLAVLFQVFVGKRVIRFKGRTHARIHEYVGYGVVAGGLLHGLLALVVYEGWRIPG